MKVCVHNPVLFSIASSAASVAGVAVVVDESTPSRISRIQNIICRVRPAVSVPYCWNEDGSRRHTHKKHTIVYIIVASTCTCPRATASAASVARAVLMSVPAPRPLPPRPPRELRVPAAGRLVVPFRDPQLGTPRPPVAVDFRVRRRLRPL